VALQAKTCQAGPGLATVSVHQNLEHKNEEVSVASDCYESLRDVFVLVLLDGPNAVPGFPASTCMILACEW
jgi:hypothetical protein